MWFDTFVKQYQNVIVKNWQTRVESEFPGEFERDYLHTSGQQYARLLLNRDIPLTEHPDYEMISRMCKFHASRGTPVEQVLHSSHIWREAMLEAIWKFQVDNDISTPEMRDNLLLMHKRIDLIQREISRLYWEYDQEVIRKKQQTIDDLHEDRLSMLGKMAASMAHEIRNPLSAIGGFLKLIKEESTGASAKINRYIDIIENEFEGLYRQITAFLSFSKNDGTVESFEACLASDIIEPVLAIIQPRMINENVEIEFVLEANPEIVVQKIAIQQILSNLLNNCADALSDMDREKKVRIVCNESTISVADNGPGIPLELREHIFEPFVTSKKNGTGLGLAICKRIMQNHGGDLQFTSKEGETVFTLSFVPSFQPAPSGNFHY